MKHIIRKVQLDVKLPTQETAWHWQSRLGALVKKEFLHQIEPLFDEFGKEDVLIRIRQLEIDIGEISVNSSNTAIVDKLVMQLKGSLSKLVLNKNENHEVVQTIEKEALAFEVLERFLEYGTITHAQFLLDPETAINLLLEKEPQKVVSMIYHLVQKYPNIVFKRIVYQFNKEILFKLLAAVLTEKTALQFVRLITSFQGNKVLEIRIWRTLIRSAIENYFGPDAQDQREEKLLFTIISVVSKEHSTEQFERVVNKIYGTSKPELVSKILKDTKVAKREMVSLDEETASFIVLQLKDPVFCPYGGIILLHPFLSTFFKTLNLLDKTGQFIDTTSQEKGVHLLAYLSTGNTNLPEQELVLEKFLCGLPTNYPIRRHDKIETTAIEESDQLLMAAIKHWGALGNVSTESLREGFLKRPGKFELRANGVGYQLTIERKTMDVLLEKLPWGISMIKLPWMKDLLHVEW